MTQALTHSHVDLDACACVALAGVEPQNVVFLPANADSLPAEYAKARVLDHDLGVKGHRDADGRTSAAVLSLPEVAALKNSAKDSDLLAEIEQQDRYGKVDRPRFSLGTILAAIRLELASRGIEGEEQDRGILQIMVPVIRGLARIERQQLDACQMASKLPVVTVGPWRFAVRTGKPIPGMDKFLEEDRKCVGVIYSEGHCLGVTRYPGHDQPDLRKLTPDLPGWFIHPAGFLACWGSRKAPATQPPPVGTPQDTDELVKVLQRHFKPW